jgi:signal peptidase I
MLDEPYVLEQGMSGEMDKVVVPEGYLFCCGDNREVSVDSRKTEVGMVNVDDVVGRVIIRLFPFNSIKTF